MEPGYFCEIAPEGREICASRTELDIASKAQKGFSAPGYFVISLQLSEDRGSQED